jgi:plasmid stability protein
MATLHVRSVPDELYDRLREMARISNRSLSAQVVTLLSEALAAQEAHARQAQILSDIRRRRFRPPAAAPDSAELLREDRGR